MSGARRIAVFAGVAVVIAGLTWWLSSPSSGFAAGPGRRVTLAWGCSNGIFWPSMSSGPKWWAGSEPVPDGPIVTERVEDSRQVGGVEYRATGNLYFAANGVAVFTSDRGGTLRLFRQPKDAFYTLECRISRVP